MTLSIMLQITSNSMADYLSRQSYQDSYVTGMIWKIIGIAEGLAMLCYLIALGWNYASNTFKKKPMLVDIGELSRTIILMLFLGIYPFVMGFVVYISDVARKESNQLSDMNNMEKYSSSLQHQYGFYEDLNADQVKELKGNQYNLDNMENKGKDNELAAAPKEDADPTNGNGELSWSKVLDMLSNPMLVCSFLLSALTYVIIVIAKVVIELFVVMLIKVLYLVGPFAVAFSILPFMRDKLADWFSVFINLCFVGVTLNILHAVVVHEFAAMATSVAPGANTPGYSSIYSNLAMNLVILFCYISVFWITGKYVGSDSAGKVFTSGLQTVSQAATAFATGGASAAASAAGAAGAAGNAAGAGKDAISGN